MGTNCAPLVADLFLFCYERDFMKSPSRENQADIIGAFNSTSKYLDSLNIDNIYFGQIMDRIYSTVALARDAGKYAERIKVHAKAYNFHAKFARNSLNIRAYFAHLSKKSTRELFLA